MSVIARSGIHALRTVTDHLGEHHSCTCALFSVPAEPRVITIGDRTSAIPAPTEAEARTRWQAHIDALRLDCDRPWRWRHTRRSAA